MNDGSTDHTGQILTSLSNQDSRIFILTLSRNFGHQAALTCGLDHAEGDIVVTMDGDEQNPPEVIPEMLALYQAGYDIVIGQRRHETPTSVKVPFFVQ